MEEKPQWPQTPITFVRRTHEFGDIQTYVFRAENPVSFGPGCYGHVRLPGFPAGVRAVREFSFANAPHEPEIEFGVDSKSRSDYQKALQKLKEGDTVTLFKIKSHMTWRPPESRNAVMVAGGVGITPFRSMLRDKAHRGLPVVTSVLQVSGNGFLYQDEVRTLADEYATANRASFVSSLTELAKHRPEAHYYLAGSPGFVDAGYALLAAQGIRLIEADPFKGLEDI